MLEGGAFGLRVGASSRDIRLTASLDLAGEPIVAPLRPDSPLGEWWDHPVGGARLRAALEGSAEYDDYRVRRLRENPMVRVARMAGFPIPEGDVPGLAAEINAQTGAAGGTEHLREARIPRSQPNATSSATRKF